MKATPKSCSCFHCKASKGTKPGKHTMKLEERAFRHNMKKALQRGEQDIDPAPHGSRIG